MKVLAILFSGLLSVFLVGDMTKSTPQSAFDGAWEFETINGEGIPHRAVMLIEAPYAFYTEFDIENKTFHGTQGGMIEVMGNKIAYTIEFDTNDENNIGQKLDITASFKANQMTLDFDWVGTAQSAVYRRIDSGRGDLAGAWRITDRMRNGQMTAMRMGPRKTIKMITGSRFQWAAYNPETKQFSGTGGGSITLENGKYTEHIEFFSRNADRVGASLTFDYKVDGDKWDHQGQSSSGNPIHEIWTRQ